MSTPPTPSTPSPARHRRAGLALSRATLTANDAATLTLSVRNTFGAR